MASSIIHFAHQKLTRRLKHSRKTKSKSKVGAVKPGSSGPKGSDKSKAILAMVCQIPKGSVATYGQIAKLAGIPKNARQVGAVLRALPVGSKVPWFRVVNSKGEISARRDKRNQSSGRDCELDQRLLLESEGIQFDAKCRVSLKAFGWQC